MFSCVKTYFQPWTESMDYYHSRPDENAEIKKAHTNQPIKLNEGYIYYHFT